MFTYVSRSISDLVMKGEKSTFRESSLFKLLSLYLKKLIVTKLNLHNRSILKGRYDALRRHLARIIATYDISEWNVALVREIVWRQAGSMALIDIWNGPEVL